MHLNSLFHKVYTFSHGLPRWLSGNAEDAGAFLGWEDPPEEEMASHSSILAWKIPWTEKPGGLQSMGHKEYDMTETLSMHTYIFLLRFRRNMSPALFLLYIKL